MTTNKWDGESKAHWAVYCPPRPALKFAYQKREGRNRHIFRSVTGFDRGRTLGAAPRTPFPPRNADGINPSSSKWVCAAGEGSLSPTAPLKRPAGRTGAREEAQAALPHPGRAPLHLRGGPRRGRQPNGTCGRRRGPRAAPPAEACTARPPPGRAALPPRRPRPPTTLLRPATSPSSRSPGRR